MKTHESGQTLIEILAALSVIVIVLTAITAAVLSALSNTTDSKNQNLATALAQQGMESMRNLQTSDYTTFSSLPGYTYCLAQSCDTLNKTMSPSCWGQDATIYPPQNNPPQCLNNINGFFTRTVYVPSGSPPPDCSAGTIEVQVKVGWVNGRCTGNTQCQRVIVTSCFAPPAIPTL